MREGHMKATPVTLVLNAQNDCKSFSEILPRCAPYMFRQPGQSGLEVVARK